MVIYFLQYMLFFLFPGQYNIVEQGEALAMQSQVNFIALESEVWCSSARNSYKYM